MDNNAGASGAGDTSNTNTNNNNNKDDDDDGNNNDGTSGGGGAAAAATSTDAHGTDDELKSNIDSELEKGGAETNDENATSPTKDKDKDSDSAKIRQTAVLVESDGFVTKNGHRVVIQSQHSRSPSTTSRSADV